MKTLDINIENITLEVEYDCEAGSDGNYFEAPYGDQVDIYKVTLENSETNITDLLSKYVINTIETKIFHYETMA